MINTAHPEVRKLIGHDPSLIFQISYVTAFNFACLYWATNLDLWAIALLAATFGAFVRMRTFNFMHEICHRTFAPKMSGFWRTTALMLLEKPCFVTMFPYYKWYHLSHHSELGAQSLDEAQSLAKTFGKADGDLLNVYGIYAYRKSNDSFELANSQNTVFRRIFYFGFLQQFLGSAVYCWRMIANNPLFESFRLMRLWKKLDANLRQQARIAILDRTLWLLSTVAVGIFFGWKGLAFLVLSHLFYRGIFFHPCLSFWLAVHKSHESKDGGQCQPTTSVYGPVMTLFCGGVNYHTEHHDYASIPVGRLKTLKQMAPDFYETVPYYTGAFHVYKHLFQSVGEEWVYGCHNHGLRKADRQPSKNIA